MNTAFNPQNGQLEECTRTDPPHFEHDAVHLGHMTFYIDTVDVDGDDEVCRVRMSGKHMTRIVPVAWLDKKDVTFAQVVSFSGGYRYRVRS